MEIEESESTAIEQGGDGMLENAKIQNILPEVTEKVKRVFGSHIQRIVLYGSYARGIIFYGT